MANPLVSVVMGTYNHATLVKEALNSVLSQDFTNFEFLVSDDGSKDGTPDIVATYTDARLQFTSNAVNRGAALVLNELVGKARGRYIAIINSDDAWMPGKLSEQVSILEKHANIGAVFGRVEFIDREGRTIAKEDLGFGQVFDRKNRSRGQWMRYFFERGNCLCHPSVLIRKDIYDLIGLYDNSLRQLPDFDMWIRVVKRADIFVSPNKMVRFRIMPGENTSSDTYVNRVRTLNEHFFIARGFFSGVSADILRQGFGDLLRYPELPTDAHVEIEKALLFLQPVLGLTHVYQIVALMRLRELLADRSCRGVLGADYDFNDRSLHRLAAEADGLQREIVETKSPESNRTIRHRLARTVRRFICR